jgi:hypothetical protein
MQHNSRPLVFIFLQVADPVNVSLDHGPLPSSSFIDNNQPTARPLVLTTATKQGRSKRKNQAKKKNVTSAGEKPTKKKQNPPKNKDHVTDLGSAAAPNLN